MSGRKVSFIDDMPSTLSGENVNMNPETAKRLFEIGATLILLDVPPKTEIGIDMHSWNTGEMFMGIKMIPPGIHFVFWSAVSSEGQTGPRTGFFHDFKSRELLAKRYRPEDEDFNRDPISGDELDRLRDNLKNLDRNLGAYPYGDWKKWVSLTNKISAQTISRLEPLSGQITSVSELLPEEHRTSRGQVQPRDDSVMMDESRVNKRIKTTIEDWENEQLPKMALRPGTEIRYTQFPNMKYPEGSTPQEITKHSMDSTYQLEQFLEQFQRLYGDQVSTSMSDKNHLDEILAELQFSFICFLVGHKYESFERWKKLLEMVLTCDDALNKYPQLYSTLINDMHFQIREVPDDFFVDIVSSNNFLVSILTSFFTSIRHNEDTIDVELKMKAERFKANLEQKFNWDFDDDEADEEFLPVVVEQVE